MSRFFPSIPCLGVPAIPTVPYVTARDRSHETATTTISNTHLTYPEILQNNISSQSNQSSNMPKALILVADGSEEIEFVTPYDGEML